MSIEVSSSTLRPEHLLGKPNTNEGIVSKTKLDGVPSSRQTPYSITVSKPKPVNDASLKQESGNETASTPESDNNTTSNSDSDKDTVGKSKSDDINLSKQNLFDVSISKQNSNGNASKPTTKKELTERDTLCIGKRKKYGITIIYP